MQSFIGDKQPTLVSFVVLVCCPLPLIRFLGAACNSTHYDFATPEEAHAAPLLEKQTLMHKGQCSLVVASSAFETHPTLQGKISRNLNNG
jgi:hypothetical protein